METITIKSNKDRDFQIKEFHLGTKKAFKEWVLIISNPTTMIIPISKKNWDGLKESGVPVEG